MGSNTEISHQLTRNNSTHQALNTSTSAAATPCSVQISRLELQPCSLAELEADPPSAAIY